MTTPGEQKGVSTQLISEDESNKQAPKVALNNDFQINIEHKSQSRGDEGDGAASCAASTLDEETQKLKELTQKRVQRGGGTTKPKLEQPKESKIISQGSDIDSSKGGNIKTALKIQGMLLNVDKIPHEKEM